MARSHDFFCRACGFYWSPFQFDSCPCGATEEQNEYDELWATALEGYERGG